MTTVHPLGWYGPTEAPWDRLLGQLHLVEPIASDGLVDYIDRSTKALQGPAVLLAVLEHRSDARWLELSSQLERWKRESLKQGSGEPSVALILGGDWQGHRRTMPLPESIECMYWFQWHDRVLPWVAQAMSAILPAVTLDAEATRTSGSKSVGGKRSVNAARAKAGLGGRAALSGAEVATRQQRILQQTAWLRTRRASLGPLNRLAWLITDCVSHQEFWADSLHSAGVNWVATRWEDAPPRLRPDLIVVDISSRDAWIEQGASMRSLDVWPMIRSHQSEASLRSRVAQVRRHHPKAMLAVVEPFPDWNRWMAWEEQGVDVVLPRPCSIEGFLFTWGLHVESNRTQDMS